MTPILTLTLSQLLLALALVLSSIRSNRLRRDLEEQIRRLHDHLDILQGEVDAIDARLSSWRAREILNRVREAMKPADTRDKFTPIHLRQHDSQTNIGNQLRDFNDTHNRTRPVH